MKEKNIQTILGKHNTVMGVFEVKLCKGKSIRWDAVAPHQVKALLSAKHEGLYHKISDSLPVFGGNKHMRFTAKKPFDCFFIKCPAYVVVCFYIPRKQKNFYYIDIDRYIKSRQLSKKKSYREEEAKAISTYALEL